MTTDQNKELLLKRNIIVEELYNSSEVNLKLRGIFSRHKIPKEIWEDIKNESFEILLKFDTTELIKAYEDRPQRILAIWLRICLNRCINVSHTNLKQHSFAPKFLLQSNLNYNNKQINITEIEIENEENIDNTIILKSDFANIENETDKNLKLEYLKNIVKNKLDNNYKNDFNIYLENPKLLSRQRQKELFNQIKKKL